jgi:hypothetical protein
MHGLVLCDVLLAGDCVGLHPSNTCCRGAKAILVCGVDGFHAYAGGVLLTVLLFFRFVLQSALAVHKTLAMAALTVVSVPCPAISARHNANRPTVANQSLHAEMMVLGVPQMVHAS